MTAVKQPELFVLPEDVLLIPVDSLSENLRSNLPASPGDFAISRANSRNGSRIVDAGLARLLEEFRHPTTIVDAIIRYSNTNRSCPEETLEKSYPFLVQLFRTGILTSADAISARRIEPSLEVGARFSAGIVKRCIQSLEDTEVYELVDANNTSYALKLLRSDCTEADTQTLANEAAILSSLDGLTNPRLISQSFGERPHLLLEWLPGENAATTAAVLRSDGSPLDRTRLLACLVGILRAFAALHRQGTIHGDVHPRNIVVAPDGTTKIIDFGLARLANSRSPNERDQRRAGIGYYFEPEYAAACIQGRPPPPPSERGEQYALGALLYYLLTGYHYLDFPLERDPFLRGIVEQNPIPFARRGIAPWKDVEAVLFRALKKEPADRFPSVQSFSDELEAALQALPKQREIPCPSRKPIDAFLLQYGEVGRFSSRNPTPIAPSLNFGSAGVAYAFYRMSCHRNDARLLSLADLWITHAWQGSAHREAFFPPHLKLSSETISDVSVFHMHSGVHCVRALVAQSLGQHSLIKDAIRSFVASSKLKYDHLDLTTGRSGALIACASLHEAIPAHMTVERQLLCDLAENVLLELWTTLDTYSPIGSCVECQWLGMAHGWAGFLYATLRWRQAVPGEFPRAVMTRLLELADLGVSDSGSLAWHPSNRQSEQPWPGWCHGSAGYVHLWMLAHKLFRDTRFQELAEKAAQHSWSNRGHGNTSLCCGYAGQVYAMLNLWRHAGDRIWLDRAKELVAMAICKESTPSEFPGSLYKGDVGIALAAADCEAPERACMPIFESEGWPLAN